MAGHREELPLPGEVVALLGGNVADHAGAGACRVVSGGGFVAKIGPSEVVAREVAVLRAGMPIAVPAIIDSGPGWFVTRAEGDDDGPWTEGQLHAALVGLARLHDAFETSVPDGLTALLRRPFTPDGADRLLEPVRRLGFPVPAPLDRLLGDPGPLVEAAGAEPPTLLHGDPWPANVLRPSPGRLVWIDWELASLGPAAADAASWLNQTPWHTGAPTDGHLEIYRAARSRPVDLDSFGRALDAAAVLWFLAYDVPHLAAGRHLRGGAADRRSIVSRAQAAAERVEAGAARRRGAPGSSR